MRKLILLFIKVYQKIFTLFGYGSCRYYPTCSQYSKMQFEKNSLYKAFYLTIVRILKCNQLFDGGFDHPVISVKNIDKKINSKLTSKDIKYWLIPKGKDKYYLIKNFNRK